MGLTLFCAGHPMGRISSQSGVQQGDPLGPLLFSLVLDSDNECLSLLFQEWFLDDGVKRSDVQCALSLIDELGSTLGIYINLPKCECSSRNDASGFPACHLPNMDILGAPIGDYLHCANFKASKLKPRSCCPN